MILVYDISSRASFVGMEKWIDEAKSNAAPNAILYLVSGQCSRVIYEKTDARPLGWKQT